MVIKGYLRTSLIEWPGKISSVVFVPGCNFRCPFCHNKDLVVNPDKLLSVSEREVFSNLKKRRKWIDGVVVTGGEPTLQSNLPEFLQKIKKLGFLTMIETNGTKPEVLKKLFEKGLVDRLTMDIKAPLNSKNYNRISGAICKIETIKESIKLILNSGVEYEFRTTVVPTLHTKEDLVDLAKQLKYISHQPSTMNHSLFWFLQQFQPKNCLDPTFEKIEPYSGKSLEEILSAVKKHIPRAELRGV